MKLENYKVTDRSKLRKTLEDLLKKDVHIMQNEPVKKPDIGVFIRDENTPPNSRGTKFCGIRLNVSTNGVLALYIEKAEQF